MLLPIVHLCHFNEFVHAHTHLSILSLLRLSMKVLRDSTYLLVLKRNIRLFTVGLHHKDMGQEFSVA